MRQYLDLVNDVITCGHTRDDRTSIYGTCIRWDLQDGYPALSTNYVQFRPILKETLWHISGSTHVETLGSHHVLYPHAVQHTHVEALYRRLETDMDFRAMIGMPGSKLSLEEVKDFIAQYLEFSDLAGSQSHMSVGHGIGSMLRDAPVGRYPVLQSDEELAPDVYRFIRATVEEDLKNIDDSSCPLSDTQWAELLHLAVEQRISANSALFKHDQLEMLIRGLSARPVTGRAIVSLYSTQHQPLPYLTPQENVLIGRSAVSSEHLCFQCHVVNSRLCLHVTLSSCAVMSELPSIMAMYALILHMLAMGTGWMVGELVIHISEAYIYTYQIPNAIIQLSRTIYRAPELHITPRPTIYEYTPSDIHLVEYEFHGRRLKY